MKPLLWDAINPLTGTPFTWDDPNLRWGEPSYYLEPGDQGLEAFRVFGVFRGEDGSTAGMQSRPPCGQECPHH